MDTARKLNLINLPNSFKVFFILPRSRGVKVSSFGHHPFSRNLFDVSCATSSVYDTARPELKSSDLLRTDSRIVVPVTNSVHYERDGKRHSDTAHLPKCNSLAVNIHRLPAEPIHHLHHHQ